MDEFELQELKSNLYKLLLEGSLIQIQTILKDCDDLKQIICNGSLFYAGILSGEITLIQYLLDIGFDPNMDIYEGDDFDAEEKPLSVACLYGYLDIVKLLVDTGASLRQEYENDCTILQAAVKGGHRDVFEYLLSLSNLELPDSNELKRLRRYLDLHIITKEEEECVSEEANKLAEAVATGNLEETKRLIDSGVSVNSTNISGISPLCYAAERRQLEIAQYLLSSGADPDFNCPLMTALGSGASQIAHLLLKAGADINQREDGDGKTVLMFATSCYIDYLDLELIKLIIQRGADVNAQDYNGLSVVDHVRRAGNGQHFRLMKLLKEAGAEGY
jgi:ankyrin repeat domain-containing protein 17